MRINFKTLVASATLALVGIASPAFAQEENLTPTEKNSQRISTLEAQVDKLSALKISGYVQAQWQWKQTAGASDPVKRNEFMVRRGRIKTTYTQGIATYCLQLDANEKKVGIKDAWGLFTNKSKTIGFQVGSMERPFGYEIGVSSASLESPERARTTTTLFPGEYDLGAQFILNGKDGLLKRFTLNAGVYNGNGIGSESDSKKDFIGRLAYLQKTDDAQFGAALSYYNGGVMGTDSVYKFTSEVGMVKTPATKFDFAKREYVGVSAQYLNNWAIGTTSIRAEVVTGTQPGLAASSTSADGAAIGDGKVKLYDRQLLGGYVILSQNIGATKHTVVVKYDMYDPNTKVKGDEIGKLSNTSKTDLSYSTIGFGYAYRLNANVKLMAYYDMVKNETSANLKGYTEKVNQDVFTARLQVKF